MGLVPAREAVLLRLRHSALDPLARLALGAVRGDPRGAVAKLFLVVAPQHLKRTVAKTKKDSLPRGHETWEGTFNGLQAAGGNKVFVLLREVMFARQRGDGAGGA